MRVSGGAQAATGQKAGVACAILLVVTLAASSAQAKSRVAPNRFPFSAPKTLKLSYPPLPKSVLERIAGQKRTEPVAKADSALGRDWALNSIGFFEVFTPALKPIRPWVEKCSDDVVVAVIDTGIDYTHPELRDSLWVNRGETGAWEPPAAMRSQITCRDKSCNGIDDDGNGFTDDVVGWDFVHDVPLPYDTHGHGTHIAGIIASAAANGMGVAGVCSRVSILPLKYYDNSGAGYNNLANTVRAIQYAVRAGAHIINYSGGGADPAATEKAAVDEASRRGVLFIAAAGNDGHDNQFAPYYPASYGLENIVGVASVNRQGQLLPSSNYGKPVHVAAPGLGILSTLPDGRYGTMSGTSQATAFVTGAAALLYSQYRENGTPDFRQVKKWLLDGARPMKGNGKKQLVSNGMLWLPTALEKQHDELKRMVPATVAGPDIASRPTAR